MKTVNDVIAECHTVFDHIYKMHVQHPEVRNYTNDDFVIFYRAHGGLDAAHESICRRRREVVAKYPELKATDAGLIQARNIRQAGMVEYLHD